MAKSTNITITIKRKETPCIRFRAHPQLQIIMKQTMCENEVTLCKAFTKKILPFPDLLPNNRKKKHFLKHQCRLPKLQDSTSARRRAYTHILFQEDYLKMFVWDWRPHLRRVWGNPLSRPCPRAICTYRPRCPMPQSTCHHVCALTTDTRVYIDWLLTQTNQTGWHFM